MDSSKCYRLGCDIGGTFTDFVLLDEADGSIRLEKCLTTPRDPAEAVLRGVGRFEARQPGIVAATRQILHGTTLVINAVLERKGAKTALITTEGFRDVLEIGTERRYDLYDLQQQYPEPLIPRDLRFGVTERLLQDGSVLTPLDTDQVRGLKEALRGQGVDSVAICLLHAYVNPAHERLLRDLLTADWPDLSVSLSSDVLPEINEYTRTSTTAVNAYCKPLMAGYLASLEGRLTDKAFRGQLLVMLSNGGVASVDTGRSYPVRMIESGPVGGVILAHHVRDLCGLNGVFAFDMGGTTVKICIIDGDTLPRTSRYEVARTSRFKPGSGIPVKVPCGDLLEVGPGGGSIAQINDLDLLQVGPRSAGSEPGPACYGRGGRNATVTDADLVLGYLDPDFFLGGEMALDPTAARQAISDNIAKPLGLSVEEAAFGIHETANESMAAATRMYASECGIDPRELGLVASGGAGPVHCYGLSAKLGVRDIIVPPAVGVASALGFLIAPASYDLVRTFKSTLATLTIGDFEDTFLSLEREAADVLARADDTADPTFLRSVDIRYVGQGYEVNIPLPAGRPDIAALERLFSQTYASLFGRAFDGNAFEIVNLRLIATGTVPASPLGRFAPRDGPGIKGQRPAWCPIEGAYVPHTVYNRDTLALGHTLKGPAIVEERESTVVIGAGAMARVDAHGLLHVRLPEPNTGAIRESTDAA